jgi:MFS family permease
LSPPTHVLLESPGPLIVWQRRLLWITLALICATRFYALAPTLWDLDEAQFAAGVREFNVGRDHHPHPPGFPLYILAAKIIRPFVADEFRACQTVTFLAACALFPLAFSLARELRFSFWTSYLAALLFVFFPNVWLYGGTAFSDIAGTAAAIAAAWLLFRGCRDGRFYFAGAVMLGVAAGIRSQALLFGLAPLAVASWFHLRSSWRRVVGAGLIIAGIVGASYIGAALSSDSISGYEHSLEGAREWVRTVDSVLNPRRPPLAFVMAEYLLRPMAGGRLPLVVCALAVIGLLAGAVHRQGGVGLAVATFLPFALFGCFMLDPYSVHRYSTSYVFLWALLAAYGVEMLSKLLGRWSPFAQVVVLALITARCIHWTLPAIQEVRRTEAPTHAAMQWLRAHVPAHELVWVHGSLIPFARYELTDRDVRRANDLHVVPRVGVSPGDFFATEGGVSGAEVTFKRENGRLSQIARKRYFETSIVRVAGIWTFDEGWYDQESDGKTLWLWMGKRGKVFLPAVSSRMALRMTLNTVNGETSDVEVWLNGQLLERFRASETPFHGQWIVSSRTDAQNELVVRSSNVVNLKARGISEDARDLGLQLTAYSWQPVP